MVTRGNHRRTSYGEVVLKYFDKLLIKQQAGLLGKGEKWFGYRRKAKQYMIYCMNAKSVDSQNVGKHQDVWRLHISTQGKEEARH